MLVSTQLNSQAGTVLLGKEQSTLGEKLTLNNAFGSKQLIISKKEKNWQTFNISISIKLL